MPNMTRSKLAFPEGVTVLERGWLSSNNIVLLGPGHSAVVDSGYSSHQDLTLELIKQQLNGRPLDDLVNTHLHSDHCGGNAKLQGHYKQLQTHIPSGNSQAVTSWDIDKLTFKATGQTCPKFAYQHVLRANTSMKLGLHEWEIHCAPGHDPDSVVLFEPISKTLISADALWENGFGVVFPELEGIDAFEAVSDTLTMCEKLNAKTIIPGHGRPFTNVKAAIERARTRLAYLSKKDGSPNHAIYAAKVLLKFHLLEHQKVEISAAKQWLLNMPYFQKLTPMLKTILSTDKETTLDNQGEQVADWVIGVLCTVKAARIEGNMLVNQ